MTKISGNFHNHYENLRLRKYIEHFTSDKMSGDDATDVTIQQVKCIADILILMKKRINQT